MADEGAVGASFNDLMEINVFGEGLKRLADLGRGTDTQGVAQVDLAQPYARGLQPCQGLGRRFVLDGQVAAVVVDAQMTVDAPVSGAQGSQSIEITHALAGGLEGAQRLGF